MCLGPEAPLQDARPEKSREAQHPKATRPWSEARNGRSEGGIRFANAAGSCIWLDFGSRVPVCSVGIKMPGLETMTWGERMGTYASGRLGRRCKIDSGHPLASPCLNMLPI